MGADPKNARMLWLAQETSEKNTPNVLLRRLLREPQQMNARFKLVTGSQRRDEQEPINVGVIVGLSGAYQARNASQMPCIRVVFDATKVEKQLPTRTVKSDDALTKNNLVACFSNRPIFCARSQSATSALFNTRLLGSSVDFVDSPLWNVEG